MYSRKTLAVLVAKRPKPALENEEAVIDAAPAETKVEVTPTPEGLKLEVNDSGVEVIIKAETETEVAAAEVEDDLRDASADDVVEEVADVAESAAALEDMAELVETFAEDGGMSSETAAAVGLGLEHIYNKLKLKKTTMNVSLESFSKDKAASTKIVMESIADKVKEVWEYIVKMFKKISQWVKDFFGDLFSSINSLSNRAIKLKQQLKAAGGAYTNKEPLVVGAGDAMLARLYSSEVNSSDIAKAFVDMVHNQHHILKGNSQIISSDIRLVIENDYATFTQVKGDGTMESWQKSVLAVMGKVAAANFKKKNSPDAPKAPDGCDQWATDIFLGNVGQYGFIPTVWEALPQLRFGTFSGKPGSWKEVNGLSPAEVNDVTDAIKTFYDLRHDAKKIESGLSKMADTVDSFAHKLSDKIADKFMSQDVSDFRRSFTALSTLVSNVGLRSTSHLVRVGRDVLRLAEASVAHGLKAEKAAA